MPVLIDDCDVVGVNPGVLARCHPEVSQGGWHPQLLLQHYPHAGPKDTIEHDTTDTTQLRNPKILFEEVRLNWITSPRSPQLLLLYNPWIPKLDL